MTESRGSRSAVGNLATVTLVWGRGCPRRPVFRSVMLQLHAPNMGKGQFLKGTSDDLEKAVARQVKATANHSGW